MISATDGQASLLIILLDIRDTTSFADTAESYRIRGRRRSGRRGDARSLRRAAISYMMVKMEEGASRSPRRATRTSVFGSGRREGHDASAFYARFHPPVIDETNEIGPRPETEGPILGDARDMQQLPDGSVALVVTSPPYFVGKEYENAVIQAARSQELEAEIPRSYGEYLGLLHDVFAECVRVLEPGGRIAVNVANLGRKPYRSLSADVIGILEKLGLLLRGEVIWRKAAGANGSCAWGSFRSPANPVLRDVTERVVIASKGRFDRALSSARRRAERLPHVATLPNDEFVEATLDVWDIPSESARRVGHPAPFPVELPLRLIDLYTYQDDLVLDPFMGSGTTLVAAHRARRRGVGYDINREYVGIAQERLDGAYRRPSLDEAEQVRSSNGVVGAGAAVGESSEHFQARAVREGKKAQDLAREVLESAGFEILRANPRIGRLGIQFNFSVENRWGQRWFVDVSGAFTTVRPGLQRTDTLWKTLGRAHVHFMQGGGTRLLIMTSNLPKTGSSGWKALKAVGPASIFDAIRIFDTEDTKRLRCYAEQHMDRPLEGFWTQDHINGSFHPQ